MIPLSLSAPRSLTVRARPFPSEKAGRSFEQLRALALRHLAAKERTGDLRRIFALNRREDVVLRAMAEIYTAVNRLPAGLVGAAEMFDLTVASYFAHPDPLEARPSAA